MLHFQPIQWRHILLLINKCGIADEMQAVCCGAHKTAMDRGAAHMRQLSMSCLVFNSCEFGQLLRARIITWSRHSKTSKTFKLYRSCCCCCDIISIIKIPNVDSFQARSASQFTGKFSLGEINLSDSNSGMTWVCWPKAMTSGSSSKQNCTVHSRFHGHKEQFLY